MFCLKDTSEFERFEQFSDCIGVILISILKKNSSILTRKSVKTGVPLDSVYSYVSSFYLFRELPIRLLR
jgi:hypothetical protein